MILTLSVIGTTGSEVEQILTIALHELMTWITKNRLVVNSDKTCVMVIGSRAYLKKIESFNVFINATLLNRVHSTKCLGVLIDDELNWSSHVDKITKTTQRNISVIRRAKIYLPQNSLKLLYNSLDFSVATFWLLLGCMVKQISISNHSTTKSSKEGSKIDFESIIRNPFSWVVYKFEMDDTRRTFWI